MNGSNGDCTCDELIAAGKCVPPPRFHDCDYVRARGEYEDFVTGFVMRDGNVWGRPVGITVANDGSLLFSEVGTARSSGWAIGSENFLAGKIVSIVRTDALFPQRQAWRRRRRRVVALPAGNPERDLIDPTAEGGRYQNPVLGQDLKPHDHGARQVLPKQRPVHPQVGG